MSIHREGYKILIFGFILLILFNVLLWIILPGNTLIRWLAVLFSLMMYTFLLFFFRLPARRLDPDPGLVYAPADGKVVVVEETEEKEYFRDLRLQVSIFMSPFNMHSNRYPVSGKIKYVEYHPGNYMVAWHPKSSELNERSTIVIETDTGKEILIRQVAGAVARRIVTYAKLSDNVRQGDELGFIKFGSRVDIFLPVGTEIEIPLLQQVKANKSVIAKI
ncbi:MAG TPA: phosphatidylserine decarboxylase family protein [Bacteroidales bacterium]|jgi:phosphatidylserine decarboxylase|nr:phosphatidylserine decarboxylase family protein [Bacteroidales bacterium]HOX75148.1 phosphatidylserine decarboxylase family protein [Bacteroidales bacterium]HPM88591.1 phosphatidylserine decarboxylase family protein [Bacteroidales bacterium]HQM67658.1 phosphatidylserine decarboxylase family protein [Bacteroidales bacterium]